MQTSLVQTTCSDGEGGDGGLARAEAVRQAKNASDWDGVLQIHCCYGSYDVEKGDDLGIVAVAAASAYAADAAALPVH